MYISRIEIDLENRKKYRDLNHVGAFHNWIESSFPDEFESNIRTRKLWRIDRLNNKIYMIVLSESEPNIEKLSYYGKKESIIIKKYDNFVDSLKNEQRCRFRIVLNPVVSVAESKLKRGSVKPHITQEHQMKYFLDRVEKYGFEIENKELEIVERTFVDFYRGNQKGIRLVKVAYEGILIIKDITKFKKLLYEGMGKKKAYGFGLMTVIPM